MIPLNTTTIVEWPSNKTVFKNAQKHTGLFKKVSHIIKVPIIPPVVHNNPFVTDFKKKAEFFNSYFANQCTLINSNSTFPVNVQYLTDKLLPLFDFSEYDIMKVIQKLDPNKNSAH